MCRQDAPAQPQPNQRKITAVRRTVKIGRPGYCVTKQFAADTGQRSLLFQIEYPEIEDGKAPRHRFMSSIEQKVEPWDKRYQYLLFAADPYEVSKWSCLSTLVVPHRWGTRLGVWTRTPVQADPLARGKPR